MASLLFSGATWNLNDTVRSLWFQSRADLVAARLQQSYYQTAIWPLTYPPWQLCDSFQLSLNLFLSDVSRYLRSNFGSLLSVEDDGPNQARPGKDGPYYKIRWRWLTLPVMLEAAGISFFFSVVWLSRKHDLPLWKSSTLGTIYHGIDVCRHSEGVVMDSTADMEDVAKKTRVRLAYTPTGYRLVATDKDI